MTRRAALGLALAVSLAGCAHPGEPTPAHGGGHTPARGGEATPAHGGEHGSPAGDGHAYRHEGHDRHHRFDDPERWAERFEDPSRDQWQKPEVVLAALALEAGDVVADIGSATGYFPVKIAPKVPDGRVWGVDIEPAMVRHLNERARRQKHDNLFSILGTPGDPLLPEPVDAVLMVNTYHHVTDRTAYFERLAEDFAPEGRLVIVDFEKGEMPVGPPDSMKIAPARMQREVEAAGYVLERQIRDELPYQYVLVFRPD